MEAKISTTEGENDSKIINIETSEGYKFVVEVYGNSLYIKNGFHNSLVITTVSAQKIKVESGQ